MSDFLQELRRRKVFRVAAVYAVVAWVLIQVAATVLPALQLPQWTVTFFTFFFILGFPIAVILAWAYEVTPEGVRPDGYSQPSQPPTPSSDRKLIYATFMLVLLAVGFQIADRFLFGGRQVTNQSSEYVSRISDVMRFSLPVSQDGGLYLGGRDAGYGRPTATSLALTNDGKQLVYSAWKAGSRGQESQLYLRQLDQERAESIAGTEGGTSPFLSPDNEWIGFYVGNSLRRIPLRGGIAQTITAETQSTRLELFGASWGDDNTIVYGDRVSNSAANLRIGLYRVAASGGSGELLLDPIESQGQFVIYSQPQLLPGSKGLLFQALPTSRDPERAEIIAMDIGTGTLTSLLANATNPRFLPETGHLLFMRQGLLMAVRFDPVALALIGEGVVVTENVMQALNMANAGWNTGVGQLTISAAGHLVYARGGVTPDRTSTLVSVTVDGEVEPLNSISQPTAHTMGMRLSPNGRSLAFYSRTSDGVRVHIHDLVRNVSQEMNSGGFSTSLPIWSPDSESIVVASTREDGISNIYRMSADGSDERPERLVPSEQRQAPQSWSSDGVIAYLQNGDIWTLPPGGEPAPFFTSEARESHATFSPDGRWVAYIVAAENSSDRELYVRPYPGPGNAVLIAADRNISPAWSRDGTQLYFIEYSRDITGRMMVVDIDNGTPSPARPHIDPWPFAETIPARTFVVLEDGSFITATREEPGNGETSELTTYAEQLAVTEMQVVLNFFDLLRQRVGK